MKFLFSILIFTVNILLSVAQELPPTGAKWYYNLIPLSDGRDINEYFLFEAIKDTVVQDSTCKKISVNHYNSSNEVIYLGDEYLKVTGDKVYNYHHGNFYLLYDFSKNVGDTLELKLGCNSTLFTRREEYIDSISIGFVKHKVTEKDSIEIARKKYLSITYQDLVRKTNTIFMSGNIIQGIGSIHFLLGTTFSPAQTEDLYGPLRCFKSPSLNFQQGDISCDTIVGFEKEMQDPILQLFPVPMKESLTVVVQEGIILEISIFNNLGQPVFSSPFNSSSVNINVNPLEKGIYFLKVKTNNKILFKKIIK